MILDELSKGLRYCDIIEKLQIPRMSYYRYKHALSKQNYRTRISDFNWRFDPHQAFHRLYKCEKNIFIKPL
jgi:hypothetical protein